MPAVRNESPRGSKLAELMPDHVLRHENGDEVLAVVNEECVPNEVRRHHRAPRPRFDGPLLPRLIHCIDFVEQFDVDVRTLF